MFAQADKEENESQTSVSAVGITSQSQNTEGATTDDFPSSHQLEGGASAWSVREMIMQDDLKHRNVIEGKGQSNGQQFCVGKGEEGKEADKQGGAEDEDEDGADLVQNCDNHFAEDDFNASSSPSQIAAKHATPILEHRTSFDKAVYSSYMAPFADIVEEQHTTRQAVDESYLLQLHNADVHFWAPLLRLCEQHLKNQTDDQEELRQRMKLLDVQMQDFLFRQSELQRKIEEEKDRVSGRLRTQGAGLLGTRKARLLGIR